jgi:hypothetical protein
MTTLSHLNNIALLLVLFLLSGCAVHYYDAQTGTEHVWGLGHMRMKAAPVTDGVSSVVSGTSVTGLGVGVGREDYYLTAGWDYRRRIVLGTNAAMALEWPNADFYNVRVGATPPFLAPEHLPSVSTNQ